MAVQCASALRVLSCRSQFSNKLLLVVCLKTLCFLLTRVNSVPKSENLTWIKRGTTPRSCSRIHTHEFILNNFNLQSLSYDFWLHQLIHKFFHFLYSAGTNLLMLHLRSFHCTFSYGPFQLSCPFLAALLSNSFSTACHLPGLRLLGHS